jgi:hypothetical protein
MIPTMIVLGLLLGRWWALALVAGGIVWPVVLLGTGVIEPGTPLLGAAVLGFLNAGVGALLHQGILRLVRRRRRRPDQA